MQRVIVYLLQMMLVSGMLTAWYWIALRNRKWHGYNRAYLLATLALSLVLPLVPPDWIPLPFAQSPALGGTIGQVEKISRIAGEGIPWLTIGCGAATIISGILLVMSGWRIAQVFRLKARASSIRMRGYDLIETDDPRSPFSFLNNLFWRRDADRDDPINRQILRHELAHIEGRHSWDGLFAQTAACLFWMNPFFWVIRRELTVVHEFIADAAAGMEGDTEGFARMLLQSIHLGQFLEPAHGFFQSPIKRRLVMLCNENTPHRGALRKMLVLPIIGAIVLFISCTRTSGPDATDQAKLKKVQLDLKLQKMIRDGVILKLSAADAKKAGVTAMEEKQLMELQLLQAEKQLQDGRLKPAQ